MEFNSKIKSIMWTITLILMVFAAITHEFYVVAGIFLLLGLYFLIQIIPDLLNRFK